MENKSKPTILIVDDNQKNLLIIFNLLANSGYKILVSHKGEAAINQARVALPDLILLDVIMPGIDGFETCIRLKKIPETKDIPIIFMTGLANVEHKIKGLHIGAVDYITKPFSQEELLARINLHLRLQRLTADLHNQNKLLQAEINSRLLAEKSLEELNKKLQARVEERTCQLQEANNQLYYQAFHDFLTELPNRAYFMTELAEAIKLTTQQLDYTYAVLFIDLNRFKIVNDSLGHEVGDKLLQQVARRLEACCYPESILARFGGDEFLILLKNITWQEIELFTQFIQSQFEQPFLLENYEFYCGASIGITSNLIKQYQNADNVLRDADLAMYKAKKQKNHVVFQPEMQSHALGSLELENDLRRAVENQSEFCLYYQPIISLKTGLLVGFEVLLRWRHPQAGLISPYKFIPLAEETGLINRIGKWVFAEACRQLQTWLSQFAKVSSITLNVNISPLEFKQPGLISQIEASLNQYNLTGDYFKLEITESNLLENDLRTKKYLQAFQDLDIGLCIDDFGTGYSCLNRLHQFPINCLKIDRSFIKNLNPQCLDVRLVQMIINLANSLGIEVVGEGISNIYQLEVLTKLGCQLGQGYLFSKPVDKDSAGDMLANLDTNGNFVSLLESENRYANGDRPRQ